MFMDLFNVDKLLIKAKEDGFKRKEYDTSQYDELTERATQLNPRDAAKLLLRKDDAVDYNTAWSVLRDMISSDDYKEEVLQYIAVKGFNLE